MTLNYKQTRLNIQWVRRALFVCLFFLLYANTNLQGKSYDWYQKAFAHTFGLMVPESAYSWRLNWWDKMRFSFHGLLHISVDKLRLFYNTTLNPYDIASHILLVGDKVLKKDKVLFFLFNFCLIPKKRLCLLTKRMSFVWRRNNCN
jgi:hypothetical protein